MFDFSKLNDLLAAPDGYRTTDALLLTYSLNLKVLNDLLQYSGITKTYFRNGQGTEFPAHVTCVMQHNRAVTGEAGSDQEAYYARLLNKEGRICKVNGNGKSVHPKLLVFLYENNNLEKKIRLIISSKNITSSNYLEGAVCLEGTPKNETVGANDDMIALIRELLPQPLSEEQTALLDALRRTDFTECIQRITQDTYASYRFVRSTKNGTIAKAMPKGVDHVRIISPFLGDWAYTEGFLKAAFVKDTIMDCDWKIITRKSVQPTSLPNGTMPKDRFFFPAIFQDEENPPTLHAKIYAFSGKNENGEDESTLLLGSANFSQNGLEHNHELMLQINANVDFVALLDRADLNLKNCEIAQEPDEDPREDEYLQPEEASTEDLLEQIMLRLESDELAQFLQYTLNKTIHRNYMLDEFIRCAVNAEDDTIINRAKAYIARNPDVARSNPYIKEAAEILGV